MKHNDVDVGLITIFENILRPHTLKKSTSGIKDTDVFIRRGSITAIATPEEIVKLAQSRLEDTELNSQLVSQVGELEQQLEEIAYSIQNISGSLRWGAREGNSRFVECIFIGLVAGTIIGWLSNLGTLLPIYAAPAIVFVIGIVASTFKLVEYGIWRTFFTSIFIGIPLGFLFYQLLNFVLSISGEIMPIYFILCAILGAVSGIIGALIIQYFESRGVG